MADLGLAEPPTADGEDLVLKLRVLGTHCFEDLGEHCWNCFLFTFIFFFTFLFSLISDD